MSASKQFLQSVWEAQGQSGYVFLAYKDEDQEWHDVPLEWPGKIQLPQDKVDLYFCPTVFSKPRRLAKYALPTRFLHADLDEVIPQSVVGVRPSIAWRTSNGRYQCLWSLTQSLDRKAMEKINQRLTYYTEADKGGWSITKVLRVPGSMNYKYRKAQSVRLLWQDQPDRLLKAGKIWQLVKNTKVPAGSVGIKKVKLPDMTPDAAYRKHRGSLPKRARELLRANQAVVGERSDRLWELECLLLEAGVPPEEVLILVRNTVWNKFSGSRRELPQLWAEIQKAASQVESGEPIKHQQPRRLDAYSEFMTRPTPQEIWTVEGIWSKEAHGLIAGEPKSYKSLIATDLSVAVASGTAFLGHFEVPETGPVIMIQEENNASMMKDRLEKITHARALMGHVSSNGSQSIKFQAPEDLPIYLMNNSNFDLTDEDDMEFLESEIKSKKPKLVVLDPIYLMVPGWDESSQQQVTPILRDLLSLKKEYDVGILIVHHYNKPRDDSPKAGGHRISGSSVFYRWFESALYVEKGSEPSTIKITPEHRGSPPVGAIHIDLDMGAMGELDYNLDVTIRKDEVVSARKALIECVSENKGITLNEAGDLLNISRARVKRLAERLPEIKMKQSKADGTQGRPPIRLYPVTF